MQKNLLDIHLDCTPHDFPKNATKSEEDVWRANWRKQCVARCSICRETDAVRQELQVEKFIKEERDGPKLET